ncbi:MAG: hypothetical protein FWE61_01665 [Micrococcales bacterium]|nr:hypothetical protein [Micrococcales bacterium]
MASRACGAPSGRLLAGAAEVVGVADLLPEVQHAVGTGLADPSVLDLPGVRALAVRARFVPGGEDCPCRCRPAARPVVRRSCRGQDPLDEAVDIFVELGWADADPLDAATLPLGTPAQRQGGADVRRPCGWRGGSPRPPVG